MHGRRTDEDDAMYHTPLKPVNSASIVFIFLFCSVFQDDLVGGAVLHCWALAWTA
jgi:hypothetical protein